MADTRYTPVSTAGEADGLELLPEPYHAATYDDLHPDHYDDQEHTTPASAEPPTQAASTARASAPVSTDEQGADSDTDPHAPARRPSTSLLQPDAGVAVEQTRYPLRKDHPFRKLSTEDRLKYSISPSTHHARYPSENISFLSSDTDSDDGAKDEQDTSREYGYWRQTRRLWRLATAEWLGTAALCGGIAGVFAYYSRFQGLLPEQLALFNVFLIALTFMLGINLTASMRSYAKLLRWLLLSSTWQPLATFDLLLRCDSLLNVCKLFWKANKIDSLGFRWKIRALTLLWLSANVGLTILVGTLGLAYNFETSATEVNVTPGPVLITDFGNINSTYEVLKYMQEKGEQNVISTMSHGFNYNFLQSMQTSQDGNAYYWFRASNVQDPLVTTKSRVEIRSHAECTALDVIAGGDGLSQNVTYISRNGTQRTLTISYNNQNLPGRGGFVAFSEYCFACTHRTTQITFFAAQTSNTTSAKVYACNNTLAPIYWVNPNSTLGRLTEAPAEYQFPNVTARNLAGAIGWNGDYAYYVSNYSLWQAVAYQTIGDPAYTLRRLYGSEPSATNISDFLASFTIKTISAMDFSWGLFKVVDGMSPSKAQQLAVTWWFALVLLCGVPGIQFVALVVVFAFANKAIIKDDSALSMAKLYLSLLREHGFDKKGCMLTGDEMISIIGKKTGDGQLGPKVIYGWKDSGERDEEKKVIGHLDVFQERDEGTGSRRDSGFYAYQQGRVNTLFYGGHKYDGMGSGFGRERDDEDVRRRKMGIRTRTRRNSIG